LHQYDLIDYLRGGMKITADFFLNFSGENIIDKETGNLHDLEDKLNPYLIAMNEAYTILQQYTTENKVSQIK